MKKNKLFYISGLVLSIYCGVIGTSHASGLGMMASSFSAHQNYLIKRDSLLAHWQDSLNVYKQNQDYLRMLDLFKKLKSEMPNEPKVWLESGQFQLQLGQIDQAEIDFKQAAALQPTEIEHWNVLIDIALYKQDYNQLLNLSNEVLQLRPKESKYYAQKAYALFQLKQSEQALQTLEQMGEVLGKIPAYYMDKARLLQELNRSDEAYAVLQDWLKSDQKSPDLYLMLAESKALAKQPKEAMQWLEEGLQQFPQHGTFHLALTDLYVDQKANDKITQALKQALEDPQLPVQVKMASLYRFFGPDAVPLPVADLKVLLGTLAQQYPQNDAVSYLLGDAYLTFKEFSQAEAYYLQALSLNDQLPEVWGQLIQVYLQQEQLDKVLEIGLEANRLFPNQPRLLYFIAKAYLGKLDYAEARQYLEQGLNAANPENKEEMLAFYADLGYVYYKLNMYDEAFVAFDEALLIDPDQALLLNNYAYYLSLQERTLDKALEMAMRSHTLDKSSSHVYDTIAWVLFQQGKYKEAKKWIEQAIKLTKPASSTVHEHYGDVLIQLGKVKKAISQWKLALQLDPTEEQATHLQRKINEKAYLKN